MGAIPLGFDEVKLAVHGGTNAYLRKIKCSRIPFYGIKNKLPKSDSRIRENAESRIKINKTF